MNDKDAKVCLLSDSYINDGRPCVELNQVQLEAKKQYLRKIEAGDYKQIGYKCVCGSDYKQMEIISEKDRYGLPVQIRICKECGMIQQNPSLDQESLNQFYNSEYRPLYGSQNRPTEAFFDGQFKHGNEILGYLHNKIKIDETTRILEIGAGAGGILYAIKKETGADVTGIDIGEEYLKFGRQHGIRLLAESVSQHAEKHPRNYNLIILSHVLEHFLDMKQELDGVRRLLSENGRLYVEVPGVKYSLKTYGSFLISIQNAHIRYFTLDTLNQSMRLYGFNMTDGDEYIHSLFVANTSVQFKETVQTNYYRDNLKCLRYMANKSRRYEKLRYLVLDNKVSGLLFALLKKLKRTIV